MKNFRKTLAHLWADVQACLQYIVMFRPNFDPLQASGGFLIKTKIKAYTKLTVVMCCKIVDKKYAAPSSGRFQRRQRRWPQVCGLSLRQLEKQSLSYPSDLPMYFCFQRIQTAVFYKKTHLKFLSVLFSCFQTSSGLVT